VILSYGRGGQYEALLGSLLEQGIEPGEILVVHNPAAPGETPPGDLRGAELLVTPSNLGYAGGMNLGIERQLEAGCELLLLLTHDARLRHGALATMLAAAESHPEYAALGPVLLLTGTEVPFSYGGIDSEDGSVHHRKAAPTGGEGVAPCDWIDGGTMLLRTAPLARVGSFDARFWGYAEDAAVWSVLWETTRAAARAAGLRAGSPRPPFAVAVGTLRGLLDFARGHWGPPPSNLPGGSDVGNTAGTG
jgi:GT2 family glycosyltransferase